MAQHGIFYMENAGGYKSAHPETTPSTETDERQPSCFALEEEKGQHWTGSGAMGRVINEARPSLHPPGARAALGGGNTLVPTKTRSRCTSIKGRLCLTRAFRKIPAISSAISDFVR